MKVVNYILVSVFGVFASQIANADECGSWGCISTISEIYTNANGSINIGTPLDEKLANCSAVSDQYFTLNPNSENAKEIYSTVLAAYMADKKIQLRVKEGSSNCELVYVRLKRDF